MIKLHLHFALADYPHIRVKAGEELGHLYSDDNNLTELNEAAVSIGMSERWIQNESAGIIHYDVWRSPLKRAKGLFKIADDRTFVADMKPGA